MRLLLSHKGEKKIDKIEKIKKRRMEDWQGRKEINHRRRK
jgi:hypothetical protein